MPGEHLSRSFLPSAGIRTAQDIFATGCGQTRESVRIGIGSTAEPAGGPITNDHNPFERISWPEVCMRLRAMAGWLSRDQPDVFDAVSADDLVSETVLEFLKSPDALGWVPARGKIEPFLCAVLKNKFIDHVRRHRRHGGPVKEEDLFAVQPEDPLEQQQGIEEVMRHVRGRKDLEDVVVAITESSGGACLNQELAAQLQIPVAEVVNRKKRIRRSCEKQMLPPIPQKEPQIR